MTESEHQIVYDAFREQERHSFLFDLEGLGISMSAWARQEQVHRDEILFKQHIELTYFWILRMFYSFVAEIFLVVVNVMFQEKRAHRCCRIKNTFAKSRGCDLYLSELEP